MSTRLLLLIAWAVVVGFVVNVWREDAERYLHREGSRWLLGAFLVFMVIMLIVGLFVTS